MIKTWGLSPKIAKWTYLTMVRPMISYGCLTWVSETIRDRTIRTLTKLRRLALVQCTFAFPGTPTAALELLTRIKPLDLHLRETALRTAIHLRQGESCLSRQTNPHKGWTKSHTDINNKEIKQIKDMSLPSDRGPNIWENNG